MELDEIRERIDTVDENMLALFLERMVLSDRVAAYKRAHSLPLTNKTREREILARVTEKHRLTGAVCPPVFYEPFRAFQGAPGRAQRRRFPHPRAD